MDIWQEGKRIEVAEIIIFLRSILQGYSNLDQR